MAELLNQCTFTPHFGGKSLTHLFESRLCKLLLVDSLVYNRNLELNTNDSPVSLKDVCISFA